jgi:hypothetical protein
MPLRVGHYIESDMAAAMANLLKFAASARHDDSLSTVR